MSLQDHLQPPFDRGKTLGAFLYGTEVTAVTDATVTPNTVEHPGEDQVGRENWFPDKDFSQKSAPARSGGMVLCRAMRNMAAFNMLPKRLCYSGNSLGTAASGKSYTALGGSKERGRAYGFADSDNAIGFPIDEFLPTAGVVQYDIFWAVIRGPATILTDMASLVAITIGAPVVAVTAAASTGVTGTTGVGGRIGGLVYGTTGATAGTALLGLLGRALSAATTNNTNTNVLVDVGMRSY